jgi:hypothetical protein
MLVCCLASYPSLKIGALFLRNVYFHRITQRYIPEDRTFRIHRCVNLISNLVNICTKVLELLHTATDRQTDVLKPPIRAFWQLAAFRCERAQNSRIHFRSKNLSIWQDVAFSFTEVTRCVYGRGSGGGGFPLLGPNLLMVQWSHYMKCHSHKAGRTSFAAVHLFQRITLLP